MKPRPRIRKPLLGFGWAGYTASAVLLALIVPVAAGVDLRYELLKLIQFTLGDEAMMFFVTRLPFPLFAIGFPTISVVTGIGVLVARRVAPYRINVLTQLFSFALCVVWAIVAVSYHASRPVVDLGTQIFGAPGRGYNMAGHHLLESSGSIAFALLIIWISRSWIVVVGLVLAFTAQLVTAYWSSNVQFGVLPEYVVAFRFFDHGAYMWFGLAFDIFTIGPLLLWAILERRKPVPASACPGCAYDLAGLAPEAPCPECGRKPASPAP